MSGQARDDPVWRRPGDKPLEEPHPVDPEQVREDTADTDACAVEDLVDPGPQPGTVLRNLAAFVREIPQIAECRRRDEARGSQAELTDPGQPETVGNVGFASL